MLDFINCNIKNVIAHQVGNQTNDEDLILSESLLDIDDLRLRELLIKFFLYPFKNTEEYYRFNFSDGDLTLNPLYQYSNSIFSNIDSFKDKSDSIALLLYEIAIHPNIKSGDLFVTTFENIKIEDKSVNALGIFKSEKRHEFLKLNKKTKGFSLKYDDGINIDDLDKGCLIFNTEKENGNILCIVDKSNKSSEAHYWKDLFLKASPIRTNYHETNQFLGITKHFVSKQLVNNSEISKSEQIDLLNRSVNYFKTHEEFNKGEFERDVLSDEKIITSFREFDKKFRIENEIELNDRFEISSQAVKKQARAFKRVLKLDENFDIHIKGDKKLIEKGVDTDGRKYYKIYYNEEK
ncbi:nucleoid-associated protein [Algoriphagus sp. D3-2-R+10]|uniref:nucleoid-associated protein n=1 Tax=Algoriphagus aurantiacus TaxID=3103948 RepID=UPI002B3AF8FE|nr:nucleoid-associated protein [Algoriphagus sp. D3-2-R+10]MEB2776383.1 nucleoid-associated protein [Algoriphagus sp. D3-2-R+10]